jgi:CBS domain-containing protein
MADEGASPTRPGRAPGYEQAWVADAMRPGVFSCSAATPLRTVAQIMAEHRIHAVVIDDVGGDGSAGAWGVVSDVDLLRALAAGALEETAGSIAATEFVAIGSGEMLTRAVQLMAEHELTHLIVREQASRGPLGVISTLDIANLVAREE